MMGVLERLIPDALLGMYSLVFLAIENMQAPSRTRPRHNAE